MINYSEYMDILRLERFMRVAEVSSITFECIDLTTVEGEEYKLVFRAIQYTDGTVVENPDEFDVEGFSWAEQLERTYDFGDYVRSIVPNFSILLMDYNVIKRFNPKIANTFILEYDKVHLELVECSDELVDHRRRVCTEVDNLQKLIYNAVVGIDGAVNTTVPRLK